MCVKITVETLGAPHTRDTTPSNELFHIPQPTFMRKVGSMAADLMEPLQWERDKHKTQNLAHTKKTLLPLEQEQEQEQEILPASVLSKRSAVTGKGQITAKAIYHCGVGQAGNQWYP